MATREISCPRAKSDMTPCVASDGRLAATNGGLCVGCGEHAADLLADLVPKYVTLSASASVPTEEAHPTPPQQQPPPLNLRPPVTVRITASNGDTVTFTAVEEDGVLHLTTEGDGLTHSTCLYAEGDVEEQQPPQQERPRLTPEQIDVLEWVYAEVTERVNAQQQPPPAQVQYAAVVEPIRTLQDMLEALKAEVDLADRHVALNPGNDDMAAIASWTKSALVRLRHRVEAGQQPPPQQDPDAQLLQEGDILAHQEQQKRQEAARVPQQEPLSPLAQALANDDPMGALQALETDGVIGEIDPDDANLMLPICTAVAELLHHQEQQTMARVVGVLDEFISEYQRQHNAHNGKNWPDVMARVAATGFIEVLKNLRQRLGGEG